MELQFVDVSSLSELPTPPEGYRFLDFIGGSKEIRCYLVPEELPRGRFLFAHENLLDPCLLPIYSNENVCVRQDSSYPIPGFYIVHPVENYRNLDELDDVTHLRLLFVLKQVRAAMRKVLNIEYIHLHYQEKVHSCSNVHYWLLPIYGITPTLRIINFQLLEYLQSFTFTEQKETIRTYNEKMRAHLKETQLFERDEKLRTTLVP